MADEEKLDEIPTEWYVVNTYAGQENRVKQYLEKRKKSMGLEDSLFQIIVAEKEETEIKNGKPHKKTKNLYSGYILVQMKMTENGWYKVRNTPYVTGFIGSSGKGAKPIPISQAEVDEVLRKIGKTTEDFAIDLNIGDEVEVLQGPGEGFRGKVIALNPEKQTASVQLDLFRRETPTIIQYSDLKKIEE